MPICDTVPAKPQNESYTQAIRRGTIKPQADVRGSQIGFGNPASRQPSFLHPAYSALLCFTPRHHRNGTCKQNKISLHEARLMIM